MAPPTIQNGDSVKSAQRKPWSSAMLPNPTAKKRITPTTRKIAPRLNDRLRSRAGDTSACTAASGAKKKPSA
jgi:hypothetical protein